MVVKDGDTLTLGGTPLRFYHHPGHSPGALSAEFTVYDNGVPHKALCRAASDIGADSRTPRKP
jgi:hypothetical protein